MHRVLRGAPIAFRESPSVLIQEELRCLQALSEVLQTFGVQVSLVPVWGRGFQAQGEAPSGPCLPTLHPFPPSPSLDNSPEPQLWETSKTGT